MLLQGKHAAAPLMLFVAIFIAFMLIQRYIFDVILWNYNVCHFLFGLAAPLVFSYLAPPTQVATPVPFSVLVTRVMATPVNAWPRAILGSIQRDLNCGLPWSPAVGALVTLCFSAMNEIIVDPYENGVSFFSAYHHLLADISGTIVFLILSYSVIGRTNNCLSQ